MLEVATGRDPLAERRAERGSGTFKGVAARYVEQHTKRHNKSWKQADALVRRYAIPRWGKLVARAITRSDVTQLGGRASRLRVYRQRGAGGVCLGDIQLGDPSGNGHAKSVQARGSQSHQPGRDLEPAERRETAEVLVGVRGDGHCGVGGTQGPAARRRRRGEVSGHEARAHRRWLDGNFQPGAAGPRRWVIPAQKRRQPIGYNSTAQFGQKHHRHRPSPASCFPASAARASPASTLPCERYAPPIETVERATPHGLAPDVLLQGDRASASDTTTMHRLTNHREGGVGDVYDRHQYGLGDQHAVEAGVEPHSRHRRGAQVGIQRDPIYRLKMIGIYSPRNLV